MVGLVKIQKRCRRWILHAKISRKSGITQLSISICFQVTFPIWPLAAILDFGFSQIPPSFSRGSWGLNFFLNTSKSSNQVSNLTMLSEVTGPPDCTQLRCYYAYIIEVVDKILYFVFVGRISLLYSSIHCISSINLIYTPTTAVVRYNLLNNQLQILTFYLWKLPIRKIEIIWHLYFTSRQVFSSHKFD